MRRATRLTAGLLLALSIGTTALAQDGSADGAGSRTVVTASATAERVRFTSPNTVVQLRLEVYDEAGQKLLDTEQRGGNVLDWHLQGGAGERVADGVYLCVLTIKNLSGRLSQKLGLVTVSGQSTVVRSAGVAELGLRQAQTVGPVESEGEGLVVKSPEDSQPVTVLANSGNEAQLARTRGALTFRVGDFFSGADREQMRLTEEGNLGIGTAKPKARLDVAGMIRAREGFAFADGSKLNVNDKGALTLTNSNGSVVPNITGTGTQDQVAKWTDNAGTLGNSTITELNGKVGIGTTSPSGQLHIFGTATQDVFAGMGPDLALGPAFNYGYAGGSFGRSAGFFNVRPDAGAVAPNPSLRFATANVERMIVTNTGNVGIGTTTPISPLHIAAPVPVLSLQDTDNAGAGQVGLVSFRNAVGDEAGWIGFGASANANAHFMNNRAGGNTALGAGGVERLTVTSSGNVGIGETAPPFRLHVVDPSNTGLRVQTNTVGGTVASFGGNGDFSIDAVNVPGGRLVVKENGNVGIGTPSPFVKLRVVGGGSTAVFGSSTNNAGVQGTSDSGVGGNFASTGGVGVAASSDSGNIMEGYSSGAARRFHITNAGTYVAGSDFAEALPARGGKAGYEPGDVLVVSTEASAMVEKSSRPYDVRLVGVYSTRPGMLGADKNGTSRVDAEELPVAIVGIVPTKVSTENGPVRPGDLLTTSSTPGYVMKASPVRVGRVKVYRTGTILGKALEPLKKGKGVIKVLVTLR